MMNRRHALQHFFRGVGATAVLGAGRQALAAELERPEPIEVAQAAARRGLPPVKITDVKVILTEVEGARFCNVKVMTDEPGLYGVGDGNHAERVDLVGQTLNEFIKPLVVGRRVDEIEDIWQTLFVAPYWRYDVDANNSMAAIDSALWDIMGKRAGLPVYQLLGGKVRPGCRMFANAGGTSLTECEDNVRALMAQGYQHIRLRQIGPGGGGGQNVGPQAGARAGGAGRAGGAAAAGARAGGAAGGREGGAGGRRTDAVYINSLVTQFEHLRKTIGFDVELCFDVHEYPHPSGAPDAREGA